MSPAGGAGAGLGALSFGADQQMQLGRARDRDPAVPGPVAFPNGVTVCSIACGSAHCAGLDVDGHVYCWGSNAHGQLGFESDHLVGVPTMLVSIADISVAEIACGGGHTVALDCNGKLWAWGQGNEGQLGHGGRHLARSPVMVPSTALFKSVSAGDLHTAAVTEKGQLFTFGSATHGQLGHNSDAEELRPREVAALFTHEIQRVCCGPFTTGVILKDGRVALCGYGEHLFCTGPDGGHLDVGSAMGLIAGLLATKHAQHHPKKRRVQGAKMNRNVSRLPVVLDLPFLARDLAFGRNHVLALSRDGAVYCWGNGSNGQCGHGQLSHVFRPRMILDGGITSISAGRYHSAAINDRGFLLTWGAGEQGQLGHGVSTKPQTLPLIVTQQIFGRVLCAVSCGPHHTVVSGTVDYMGSGSDVVDFKTGFDLGTKLKQVLVERQGGKGTGVTQRHLAAVRAAQNGNADKVATLLAEALPAGNRKTKTIRANLRTMLDRVGLKLNSSGTVEMSASSPAGKTPGILVSPKQLARTPIAIAGDPPADKEPLHDPTSPIYSSVVSTPPLPKGGRVKSPTLEERLVPESWSEATTPQQKRPQSPTVSIKSQRPSSGQSEPSSPTSLAQMRRAFFFAESRRRSDLQLERGHRPVSARVRPASSAHVPSRPTSARNAAARPGTLKRILNVSAPGSSRSPGPYKKTGRDSWTADDEDAINQAGMVASRIAVYSDQREVMDRSKKAMAAASKVMGRNTGSLQNVTTNLRAQLDRYSVLRRKREENLKDLELEFARDKEFAEQDEERIREAQEKVEDLEHSRYVADIAMVETLGKCKHTKCAAGSFITTRSITLQAYFL